MKIPFLSNWLQARRDDAKIREQVSLRGSIVNQINFIKMTPTNQRGKREEGALRILYHEKKKADDALHELGYAD